MRNAIRAVSYPVVAAALMGAGGCSGTAPTLSLTDAFVVDRSDAGTVVHVIVRADNPTKDALPMWAVAYAGKEVDSSSGSTERWAQATAPAGGSVAFELPVVATGQVTGNSPLTVSAKIEYVPGGKLRELLNELGVPLPTTSFTGAINVDWSAAPRPVITMRPGEVRTALILDPGPIRAVDTLPPLKKTE